MQKKLNKNEKFKIHKNRAQIKGFTLYPVNKCMVTRKNSDGGKPHIRTQEA